MGIALPLGERLGVSIPLGGVLPWVMLIIALVALSAGQAFALSRHIANPKKWSAATFSGWILGFVAWGLIAVISSAVGFTSSIGAVLELLATLAIFAIPPVVVGLVQWFVALRELIATGALKWIGANVAGWVPGTLLGGGMFWAFRIGIADMGIHVEAAGFTEFMVTVLLSMWIPGAIIGAFLGAVTGAVLMRLLRGKLARPQAPDIALVA